MFNPIHYSILFSTAALLAFAPIGAHAQIEGMDFPGGFPAPDEDDDGDDAGKAYKPKSGSDITETFKNPEKKLKFKAASGIKDTDHFRYDLVASGNVTVTVGGVTAHSATTSSTHMRFVFAKGRESTSLRGEAFYDQILTENVRDGQSWAITVAKGDKNTFAPKLTRNGKEVRDRDETTISLPNPATLQRNLSSPVAFFCVGNNNELQSAAHRTDWQPHSDASGNLASLLDPLYAMRVLFAGYAGREVGVNETLEFKAPLALNSANALPVNYTLKLKLTKVFGTGEKAESGHFEVEAVPSSATVSLGASVEAKAPVLTGSLRLDVQKGVATSLSLTGNWAGVPGAAAAVGGTLKLTADLTVPKE